MENGMYTLHRRAKWVLQDLDPEELAQIRESLSSLVAIPVNQWPAALAKRLPGDPPLYLVRVSDAFRAFVQVAEGQPPEVQDIVLQGRLDALANAASSPGN